MQQNNQCCERPHLKVFKNITYFTPNHTFCQADIEIRGDKIDKILPPNTSKFNNAVDASHLVCFPGLVNAHLHPSKELYGGIKAFSGISEVLDAVHKNNHIETPELQQLASNYSILNAMRQGCTTLGIFTSRAEVDAETAKNTGIRTAIHFSQNDHWIGKESKPSTTAIDTIVKKYQHCVTQYESEKIKIHPATANELTATDDLLRELSRIAFTENKKFALHISEGKSQVDQCVAYHGKSGPQRLNAVKSLTPSTVLIHAAHLLDDDINILSDANINFVHCPVSNSFTGAGRFPAKIMNSNKIAMGTDAAMVNPFNKLAFDASFSLYFHGEDNLNHKMSATQIVDSITQTGAEALGIHNLGKIAEGSLADICFFDNKTVPLKSPNPSLVFLDVLINQLPTHVMINGELLIQDNHFLNVDYESTKNEFLTSKNQLKEA